MKKLGAAQTGPDSDFWGDLHTRVDLHNLVLPAHLLHLTMT